MSFKKFSATHNTPVKDSPAKKSTDAPAAAQPTARTDKTPAAAAPARKP